MVIILTGARSGMGEWDYFLRLWIESFLPSLLSTSKNMNYYNQFNE